MKKIFLVFALFMAFFACKKDPGATTFTYNQAIDSLHLTYNHGYTIHFTRNGINDSDFVIFHSNGTVSEVSHYFDYGSYTYPDTMTYAVTTSFDYNITWNQIPNALVMTFYPIKDTIKGYLMHDYLNTDVMYLYQSLNNRTSYQIKWTPTLPDTTSVTTGVLK